MIRCRFNSQVSMGTEKRFCFSTCAKNWLLNIEATKVRPHRLENSRRINTSFTFTLHLTGTEWMEKCFRCCPSPANSLTIFWHWFICTIQTTSLKQRKRQLKWHRLGTTQHTLHTWQILHIYLKTAINANHNTERVNIQYLICKCHQVVGPVCCCSGGGWVWKSCCCWIKHWTRSFSCAIDYPTYFSDMRRGQVPSHLEQIDILIHSPAPPSHTHIHDWVFHTETHTNALVSFSSLLFIINAAHVCTVRSVLGDWTIRVEHTFTHFIGWMQMTTHSHKMFGWLPMGHRKSLLSFSIAGVLRVEQLCAAFLSREFRQFSENGN